MPDLATLHLSFGTRGRKGSARMWVWYNTAPWWARWLMTSAWMTLWMPLLFWAMMPHHWWTPWPAWVTIAGLIAFGLLAAVPFTVLAQPVAKSYATVLNGLTVAQRAAVAAALRRKPIPTDPAVLTAAVRASDLAQAYRDRVSPVRRRVSAVLLGVLVVALPTIEFLGHRPRMGLLYLAVAAVALVLLLRPVVLRRRRRARLAELRAAAAADPLVAASVAEAVAPVVPSTRERRLSVGLILALAVATSMAAVAVRHVASRDCRTGIAVVRDIADHWDLLDANGIGPGGPALSEYKAWSQRMRHYADQVNDPTIDHLLSEIVGLSVEAVAIVEQVRAPGVSNEGIRHGQARYVNAVGQLIGADKRLLQTCQG